MLDIVELETKLNDAITRQVEILNCMDKLTLKLHKSKEFKELELTGREVEETIKSLKIEIQKAKLSKIKVGQYYKMYNFYIYLFNIDKEFFHYIKESGLNNTNILFNSRFIEYFEDIKELSIDDEKSEDFNDFKNNVQRILKVLKGE